MGKTIETTQPSFLITTAAMLCGSFVLLPFKFKPYTVALFLLISLYFFLTSKDKPTIPTNKFLIYCTFFLIYFISIFFSEDKRKAFSILGRIVPIIIVPLGFCLLDINLRKKFVIVFKRTFTVAMGVYALMIFIYLHYLGYYRSEHSLWYCYSYITNEFYGFNEHPIYISVYLAIALLFILTGILSRKFLSIALFFLLFSCLLILARKGVIISFIVVSSSIILLRNTRKTSLIMFVVLFTLFAAAMTVSEIRNRFLEVFDTKMVENNSETSTGIRYILWDTSSELIAESNFLGYGVGDVRQVFDKKLRDEGYPTISTGNYNAHNQYLQIGLSAGIIGVVLFVLSLIYFIIGFIRQHEYISVAFFVFFVIIFNFECLLERQNGIIIYSFITSLFLFGGKNH